MLTRLALYPSKPSHLPFRQRGETDLNPALGASQVPGELLRRNRSLAAGGRHFQVCDQCSRFEVDHQLQIGHGVALRQSGVDVLQGGWLGLIAAIACGVEVVQHSQRTPIFWLFLAGFVSSETEQRHLVYYLSEFILLLMDKIFRHGYSCT